MHKEPWLNPPTHGQAHANTVMAALALLTNSCVCGVVRADTPFQVDGSRARHALLELATAIQTEVSLSIFASDPLIADASHKFAEIVRQGVEPELREHSILEVDRVLHEWVSMLSGRGEELNEIAELILQRGELPLTEIAARLKIAIPPSDCL